MRRTGRIFTPAYPFLYIHLTVYLSLIVTHTLMPSKSKHRRKDSDAESSNSGGSAGSASSRASQLLTKAKGTVKKTVTRAVNFLMPKKSSLQGSTSDSPLHTRRGTVFGTSSKSLGSTSSLGSVSSVGSNRSASYYHIYRYPL